MKRHRSIRIHLILTTLLAGLLLFGLTGSSQAADFREGDTVIIEAGEVIDDDLFIAGNRIEMNGTVKGNLFVTGAEVVVNGPVEGSLFMAGQSLYANGPIGGSLYGGGYALILSAETTVARNLYFGGFSLETERGSTIGRGLYAGGYQTILNGQVADDVSVGVAALELNGAVGGDVNAEVSAGEETAPPFMPAFDNSVSTIRPGFHLSEEAEVSGDLNIRRTRSGSRGAAEEGQTFRSNNTVSTRLGEFIALLLIGGLLLYIVPTFIEQAGSYVQAQSLPSAGWGLVLVLAFFIALPVALAVLILLALLAGLITLGHLFGTILSLGLAILAVLVTGFIFTLALITKTIVLFLVGRLALDRLAPQLEAGFAKNFAALTAGAFIYEILRAIPLGLGWLIGVIVTLVGLGSLYLMVRKAPPVVSTAGD